MLFEEEAHTRCTQGGKIGSGSHCMGPLMRTGRVTNGIIQLSHLEELLEGMVIDGNLHPTLVNP